MNQGDILHILEQVEAGQLSSREAMLKLKQQPFEDIGFAKIDHHRALRQGVAEVIYGAGKTAEQISRIADVMGNNGQKTILITRLSAESAADISQTHALTYYKIGRVGIIGELPKPDGLGENCRGNGRDQRYAGGRGGCADRRGIGQ